MVNAPAARERGANGLRVAWACGPLLFAIYPVVFLFHHNIGLQESIGTLLQALAVVLAGVLAVLALALVVLRDRLRAGAVTTLAAILFFSYGHVWNLVGSRLGNEALVLAAWSVLALAGVLVILRLGRGRLEAVSRGALVIGGVLVLLNLIPIVTYQLNRALQQGTAVASEVVPGGESQVRRRPDIYFIVPDRYAGERTLAEQYGFDNSYFLDALRDRGFYVADRSFANYQATADSLASSLNFEYLTEIEPLNRRIREGDRVRQALGEAAQGSFAVERFLHARGYSYVHVPTWWDWNATNSEADAIYRYGSGSEFSSVLVNSTVLRAPEAWLGDGEASGLRDVARAHTLYQLEQLPTIADLPGPKFVFVHLSLPHQPYVFDAQGDPLAEEVVLSRPDSVSYTEQLAYANRRLLDTIDRLLDGPAETHPVIILQADEGPHFERLERDPVHVNYLEALPDELHQKFSILSAFYLPGVDDPGLYPSISPVNSFRVVFNAYFGADLPLLPDRSYVWRSGNQGELVDITDRIPIGSAREHPRGDVSYAVHPPLRWDAGDTREYNITLTNHGATTWEREGPHAVSLLVRFGADSEVAAGATAFTSAGLIGNPDRRFTLPADVPPGDSVTIPVQVTAPVEEGSYVLRHRLVEGIEWFDDISRTAVRVTASDESWARVLGAAYSASPPRFWPAGVTRTYDVTVTNTGRSLWNASGANRVRLGVQFTTDTSPRRIVTDRRFDLPAHVQPGESITISVPITAPAGGTYLLRHRMVKEQVAWFDDLDDVAVTVRLTPESWPSVLRATYAATPPRAWEARETSSYEVSLTNTGLVTWNADGPERVRLGVHFGARSDEPGVGWVTDERFDLPRDIAPGASVTLRVTVTAPGGGEFVLRHRLVKEEVAWFSDVQAAEVGVTSGLIARSRLGVAALIAALVAGLVAHLSAPSRRTAWARRWRVPHAADRRGHRAE